MAALPWSAPNPCQNPRGKSSTGEVAVEAEQWGTVGSGSVGARGVERGSRSRGGRQGGGRRGRHGEAVGGWSASPERPPVVVGAAP